MNTLPPDPPDPTTHDHAITVRFPTGASHIALMTPDLDRYRTFYEEVVGVQTLIVMSGDHGRHALLAAGSLILHVFEMPRVDPSAFGGPFGRGRLDHFGFTLPDIESFQACTARLVAAGVSISEVTSFGAVLSVSFVDVDGCDGELNCLDPDFDPTPGPGDLLVDPDWYARVVALMTTPPRAPVGT